MNKILKILCGVACAFVFCFLAIGYAAVQDTLSVIGSVSIEKQEEEIVISCADTDAYVLDGTTGELTIRETYIGAGNKTYRVIGIKENGFSSDSNAVGYDASRVTSVTIPQSVKTIGANAFTGCSNLKSFTVDSENEYFIAIDQVLFNKAGTNLLRYPACNKYPSPMLYHIPSATNEINAYAFCDLPESTVVVTQDSAGNPWGAASACLILEAPDHYNAIQNVSGDSENGYTLTCDSSFVNTNIVFVNGNTKKWMTINDSAQFTVPLDLCNSTNPSAVKVSAVVGDINNNQLNTDINDDGQAVIGGGIWPDWSPSVNNVENLVIEDGVFQGLMQINGSNATINGGEFQGDMIWCENGSTFTINGGKFTASSMHFYNETNDLLTVNIHGGIFNWKSISFDSAAAATTTITGGTFGFDPSSYVPAGYTVVDNGNGTWTVVPGANAALVNEEETTICSCETKCADLNDACEVCKTDITNCKGTEAPDGEELTCSCETKCTELTEACEVCKTDIVLCKGTEVTETTEPESSAGDSPSNGEQGEQPTEDAETTTPSDVSDGAVTETEETQTPDGQNAPKSEETSEPVISTDPAILPPEDEEDGEEQESSDDQQGQE